MSKFEAESEDKAKNQEWGEAEREMFSEIADDRKNMEKSKHGSSVWNIQLFWEGNLKTGDTGKCPSRG